MIKNLLISSESFGSGFLSESLNFPIQIFFAFSFPILSKKSISFSLKILTPVPFTLKLHSLNNPAQREHINVPKSIAAYVVPFSPQSKHVLFGVLFFISSKRFVNSRDELIFFYIYLNCFFYF